MGWLIAAAILVALCLLPIRILASYDAVGAKLGVGIGPVRIDVFPQKRATKKKPATSSAKKKTSDKATEKNGGNLTDFLPLLEVVLELVSELHRRLVVKYLEFKLVMTADDPCDLSINYGRAWAAVGNILPVLERFFVLKKRDIDISCDYMSDNSSVYVNIILSISFGRLLLITLMHGSRALKIYTNIINKRKGGANT